MTATGVVNFLNFTFSALLGPVFAWCANKMGIKRSLLTTRGGGTHNTSSSKNFAQSATTSMRDGTDVELQKARKASAGACFYRLPDSQISGDTARAPDAELRLKHGYGYTVTSQPGKGKSGALIAKATRKPRKTQLFEETPESMSEKVSWDSPIAMIDASISSDPAIV